MKTCIKSAVPFWFAHGRSTLQLQPISHQSPCRGGSPVLLELVLAEDVPLSTEFPPSPH